MASAYDLVTVADAAARLRVSSADVQLPGLVLAASRKLANWVGYPLQRRTGVEEYVVGQGGPHLFLAGGAVQSITSVAVGGVAVAASEYHLEDARFGRLVGRGRVWPFTGAGAGGIANAPFQAYDTGELLVTYTAGWWTPGQVALGLAGSSDLPAEFREAALVVVTAWYSRAGRDVEVTSHSLGDASESFQGPPLALPALARSLVGEHRKLTSRTF